MPAQVTVQGTPATVTATASDSCTGEERSWPRFGDPTSGPNPVPYIAIVSPRAAGLEVTPGTEPAGATRVPFAWVAMRSPVPPSRKNSGIMAVWFTVNGALVPKLLVI